MPVVNDAAERLGLGRGSFAVEVASNGYQQAIAAGIPCLGIGLSIFPFGKGYTCFRRTPSSFAGPSVPLPVPGESGQALLVALRGRGLYLGTVIAGEAALPGRQPTAVPRGGGEDTGSRPSAPVAAAATPPSSTSPAARELMTMGAATF